MSSSTTTGNSVKDRPERRAEPRYSPNPEVQCRVYSPDESENSRPAEIHNISTQGVRVFVGHKYEVGTPLLVELSGKGGSLLRELMVRVTRTSTLPDGRFALGCNFMSPLEGHELLALAL